MFLQSIIRLTNKKGLKVINMLPEKHTTTIQQHEMFYRTMGQGKETIVLMHGIPTHSYLWVQIMNMLSDEYQVIAPDLIGFGQSSRAKSEEITLPKQAEYIIELLDQLQILKAHFIGHDLGGGIAQILATKYTNRVASMVVCDGVTYNNWPLPMVVSIRKPTAPEFEPTPLLIERMLRGGLYHQHLATPNLIEQFTSPFAHLLGGKELQMASFALDHHQTQDLVDELPSINMTSTFIWGEHDPYIPPYWAYVLKDVIPNSEIRLISDASHYCMIDNPIEVYQSIINHLERYQKTNRG
jgi:2-hydroxymuconate-semialdehyde hydrolase